MRIMLPQAKPAFEAVNRPEEGCAAYVVTHAEDKAAVDFSAAAGLSFALH